MSLVIPMLAKTFGAGPSCGYQPGMIVQPKLNGIRALYQDGQLVSRDGEIWSDNCLTHIKNALSNLPSGVILDGELYTHGLPLQTINSRCSVVRTTPHRDEATIAFHVFDYISTEPCSLRLIKLSRLNLQSPAVTIVDSFLTSSEQQACEHYLRFKSSGYEGMMYRDAFAPYAIPGVTSTRKDNRVSWLLKRKDWLDLEAIIVGIESGDGKHSGVMSSFILSWEDKIFKCSSGPSDLERAEYMRLGPLLKGKRCRIEYRELTKDGTPFHGRIVQVELPLEATL